MRYIELDHTADLRFRVYGADERELFVNAAFAIADKMVALDAVRPAREITVEASGADIEETLVNFLAELLYGFDTEKFIAKEVEVRELSPSRVSALVRGEALDPSRHEFKHHIKAVTFYDVHVTRGAEGFEVTITCDV